MAPYEALYRLKCQTPIYWNEVREKKIITVENVPWINDAYEKVKLIKQGSRQPRAFRKAMLTIVEEIWNLKWEKRSFSRYCHEKKWLGKKNRGKLGSRYVGAFEILQRVGQGSLPIEVTTKPRRDTWCFSRISSEKVLSRPSTHPSDLVDWTAWGFVV